jgi:hypothetical protein
MLLHRIGNHRTGQQGGDGPPVSFGRIGGATTTSTPTKGFLSLMRAATALLGYAVMARLSRRGLPVVATPVGRFPETVL